jgi:arylsulfatase A-like enzyme
MVPSRGWSACALCLTLWLAACRGGGPTASPTAAPVNQTRARNVLLIVIDTLRADHLGAYGYARPSSPHIDAFARQAALFEHGYSHAPWTMPSVASMFTSLEPKDHGISDWQQPLDLHLLTLAEQLQAHGYRTEGYVSHGVLARLYQFDQGFDVYDSSVVDGRLPRDITTAREVTDLAVRALERPLPQPFFLWVHYFDPHDAYLNHAEHPFGLAAIDRYDSEIAYTDVQVGRLLGALERAGRRDDTVVALLSDHGEGFGAHRHLFHTVTLFDELLHIPYVLRVPGVPAQRVSELVRAIDLAPTLLSLLGQPIPPQFRGSPIALDARGRFVVGAGRPLVAETRRFADLRALRLGRYKLILDRAQGRRRLFDVEADPTEQRNLAKQRPDVAERLQALLEAHYAQGTREAPRRTLPPDLERDLKSLGYVQ